MDYLMWFGVLVALDYIYFKFKYVRPNGPPVWYGFPFIGFLPIFILPRPIFRVAYRIFLEWMPGLFIARVLYPSLVVKDPYIQEVQKNDACLQRSSFAITDFIGLVTTGRPRWLFFDGGSKELDWRGHRRTNVQALYILPKREKFSRIAETVSIFLKRCDEKGDKFCEYERDLIFSMLQTASNLNLGRILETESVQGFLDGFLEFNARAVFFVALVTFIPVSMLKFVERHFDSLVKPMAVNRIYKEFWKRVVLSTEPSHSEPTNYVEAVLRNKKPEEAVEYIRENMAFDIAAETLPMVHAVVVALSHLALNPHFQQKIADELVSVVGKDELSADHLERLHYLKAACNESLRISAPVIGMARHTSEKTKIGEYEVPADMNTILCFHSENLNAEHFPEPYVFNPERFVNNDGFFEDNPKMAVFSRGRRKCPGAEIAKLTLHIYLAKIIQHFELVPEDVNYKLPTLIDKALLPAIPSLPLKFIPRATAPPIKEVKLQTGLTEIYNEILEEDARGDLHCDF